MRKYILLFLLLGVIQNYSQVTFNNDYTVNPDYMKLNQNQFEDYIFEVYQEEGLAYIKLNNAARYNYLKSFFQSRIFVTNIPKTKDEKYQNLMNLPLLNQYNNQLKYDTDFNIDTFNPFKYDINFSLSYQSIYRIAESDYVLIVHPF